MGQDKDCQHPYKAFWPSFLWEHNTDPNKGLAPLWVCMDRYHHELGPKDKDAQQIPPELSDQEKVYAAALTQLLTDNPKLLYAYKHHFVKRGQNLNFRSRPYLLEFYCMKWEKGQVVVIQKSVQCGLSEFLILNALYCAGLMGLWVLYVMPTAKMRDKFVRLRVDTAIALSPEWRRLQKLAPSSADAVAGKRFGVHGALSFIGSNAEDDFTEYPADMVFIDELDRCNQANLSMATNRFASSDFKILYNVSNPTICDYGINKWYNKSNKQVWMQKCQHCNNWSELNWFTNVVRRVDKFNYELLDTAWQRSDSGDPRCFCLKCKRPLNRLAPGAWVALQPSTGILGYRINQIYAPTTTIRELAMHPTEGFFASITNTSKLMVFYRDKLGEAYSPEGTSLTEDILLQSEREYALQNWSPRATCMGVDVGRVLHVVISDCPQRQAGGQYKRVIAAFTVNSFAELSIIIKAYKVVACVVDADPETRAARDFQAKHPGIVYLNRFQKEAKIEDIAVDDSLNIIKSDRTQLLDLMVADFAGGYRLLPADSSSLDKGHFWKQLLAPKRIFKEESNRFIWHEDDREDHYFLAMSYNTMAHEIYNRGINSTLVLTEYNHFGLTADQDYDRERRMEELEWMLPEVYKKIKDDEAEKKRKKELDAGFEDPYHREPKDEETSAAPVPPEEPKKP